MIFGYHVSIKDGLDKAIDRGQELGCETIQIFTSSPRSWNYDLPKPETLELFKKKWKASEIKQIAAHSIYLTNLASQNPYIANNTINSLLSGLEVCEKLGFIGLITHVGSHRGRGIEEGTKQAVKNIEKILGVYKGKAPLILEISSGAGDLLGRNFFEIKNIFDNLKDSRIAICVDTAHAFASGYNIKTKEGLDKMLEEIDNYIGIEKLKVLHLNDSKSGLGSNIDRHENIGQGELGLGAFRNIVNHPKLKNLPAILETPGFGDREKDKRNLEIIKSLQKDGKENI